jgi:hypothetical protein
MDKCQAKLLEGYTMKTLLTILITLALTTSAFADYSGSAVLDWSSLTFSEPVDLIQRSQQQFVTLLDVDIVAFNAGAVTQPFPTFNDGFYNNTGYSQQTVSGTLANFGTASSFSDATQLGVALGLSGSGLMNGELDRNSFVTAAVSGPLTVSIGYHIAYTNAPQNDGNSADAFMAHNSAQLILTDPTGLFKVATADVHVQQGSSAQSGVLSVTQWVTAGVQSALTVNTFAQVQQPRSVPIPGTVWLLGSGLVLLAVWRARRRV